VVDQAAVLSSSRRGSKLCNPIGMMYNGIACHRKHHDVRAGRDRLTEDVAPSAYAEAGGLTGPKRLEELERASGIIACGSTCDIQHDSNWFRGSSRTSWKASASLRRINLRVRWRRTTGRLGGDACQVEPPTGGPEESAILRGTTELVENAV